MKSLRQAFQDFFRPDSVEVNAGFIKLTFTDQMRGDVALVLAELRKRRVLFAKMENELWIYVFPSLRQLRDSLAMLSGRLTFKGPHDVKTAVNFMLDGVNLFLTLYEAKYELFMATPWLQGLASPHRERNWPLMGEAADDLLALRSLIQHSIAPIEQYAEQGDALKWDPPTDSVMERWRDYATRRLLCPRCLWNMDYREDDGCHWYTDECPVYPTTARTVLFRCNLYRLHLPQDPTNHQPTVEVAGSFSGWKRIQMTPSLSEWQQYIYRRQLPIGRHHYKYVVDGNWFLDPNAKNSEQDSTGNSNSVLVVPDDCATFTGG